MSTVAVSSHYTKVKTMIRLARLDEVEEVQRRIESESGLTIGLGSIEISMKDSSTYIFIDDGLPPTGIEPERIVGWATVVGNEVHVSHVWGPSSRWIEILKWLNQFLVDQGHGQKFGIFQVPDNSPLASQATTWLAVNMDVNKRVRIRLSQSMDRLNQL